MPGKHVHFSRTTTVHSPPTPLSSLSSFSPASSASLLTPPSPFHVLPGPSPYIFPPLPPSHKSYYLELHPLLCHSSSPALNFKLTQSPSTISSQHRGIPRSTLLEAATSPPVAAMTIASPYLPWKIRVSALNQIYVTVDDVLEDVYRSLRVNVTPEEYYGLPSEKAQRRVATAYEDRYKRLRDSRGYEEEKARGLRRVDFLIGHTRFMGLSRQAASMDGWVLNTTQ